MIIPSTKAGLAQLEAIASFIDRGASAARFIVYDDTKPLSINTAANNNARLIELELPKPCLYLSAIDRIELKPTLKGVAIKGGEATWARLFNGDGDPVADFSIGTDIILNNNSIVLGSALSLDSIVFLTQ